MSRETIRRQHRFTITPEHLILDPRVSDRGMRLWCRLDRYAGDHETAFPSRETLALDMDCSLASIDRAVKELCDAGWLRKDRRAQGDVNEYVLIVAPEKATQRLIDDARKARVEASAPRRESAAAKRREQKQRLSVKQSENAQVTQGGVITSDDTPDRGGVVTGDERGVVTREQRGVVTGDEEKEATLEGSIIEGDSEPSLRSDSAQAIEAEDASDDEPLTLIALPQASVEETPRQVAYRIVRAYLTWFEQQTGAPILKKHRAVEALRKEYVEPALEAGASEDQIKAALANTHSEWPTMAVWRRCLRDAMGGTNLAPVSQFPTQRAAAYSDDVWGTLDERIAEAEQSKSKTEAEIAAEVAAAFAPTGRRAAHSG